MKHFYNRLLVWFFNLGKGLDFNRLLGCLMVLLQTFINGGSGSQRFEQHKGANCKMIFNVGYVVAGQQMLRQSFWTSACLHTEETERLATYLRPPVLTHMHLATMIRTTLCENLQAIRAFKLSCKVAKLQAFFGDNHLTLLDSLFAVYLQFAKSREQTRPF